MSDHNSDFRIVSGLIDSPLNEDGSFKLSGYKLVKELLKSFEVDQLQDVSRNIDKLKLELEKQILSKV